MWQPTAADVAMYHGRTRETDARRRVEDDKITRSERQVRALEGIAAALTAIAAKMAGAPKRRRADRVKGGR